LVEGLGAGAGAGSGLPVWFCADEGSQRRRGLAEVMAAEGRDGVDGGVGRMGKGKRIEGRGEGYELEWCVAALEVEGGDLDRARQWLRDYAPTKAESSR